MKIRPHAIPPLLPTLGLSLLAILIVQLPARGAEAEKVSRACRMCHQDEHFTKASFEAGPHDDLACNDCHQGYQLDPHKPVELPDEETLESLAHLKSPAPDALVMCAECHSDVVPDDPREFPHGKSSDATKPGHPYCLDCHGEPHLLRRLSKLEPYELRIAMNERCIHCHGDEALMEAAGVSTHVVESYEHSMHFRKLNLGHTDAPGCVDCHGGHEQSDLKTAGAEVCAKCHEDATPEFVALASHAPYTREERPISFWTVKFFGLLTFLTIMVLMFHIVLDFVSSFRARPDGPAAGAAAKTARASTPPAAEPATTPDEPEEEDSAPPAAEEEVEEEAAAPPPAARAPEPEESVLRFDIHQRLQHAILALSFASLVLTGWPLSAHGVGTSSGIVSMLGGLENCALIHRIAAIGLATTSLYHVVYLVLSAKRRRKPIGMIPSPLDVRDLWHNVMFFLGLRAARPHFGKYSYIEKFDYWAVFWGMVIMLGSGSIRWFPDLATTYLPPWVYEIAFHAHADEALLAALAIFIWHFYNVHLRPAVFPMSWVFITGRQSMEEVAVEHPAQYEEILAERAKGERAKGESAKGAKGKSEEAAS